MKRPKTLVCRFCGDVCERPNQPDYLSGWTHNHPSRCPYRTDRMPSLNGVHVGDVWRNRHTKKEKEVIEIRLGGVGTYADREPVILFEGDYMGSTLWSLVEHYDPVTRPGEYPVPWTRAGKRRGGGRFAYEKWRGPGYRREDKPKKPHAYWHAYHHVSGYTIEWERTNVLWQVDPEIEKKFALMDKRDERVRELLASEGPVDVDDVLAALALGS